MKSTYILKDSEGTSFIRVCEASIPADGTPGQAELWQKVGEEGADRPYYGRRMPTPGIDEPPRFFTFA